MENSKKYIAIMAGGVGSRFWPASRESLPKQFLDILGVGKSLIQLTYDRALQLVPKENILIATNKRYKELVNEHLPDISDNQILLEPSRNNTAPCIAYLALKIANQNPDSTFAVWPSDHVILKETEFNKKMNLAFSYAEKGESLVTLGIQPTRPDTGYGYIEVNHKDGAQAIEKVVQFKEKPDLETAQGYLDAGNYFWNAGIFIWSVRSIIKNFKTQLPAMYSLFQEGNDAYNTANETDFIEQFYGESENISIDFGIMEKASNVYTLPVDFGWNDLGTWGSLYNKLPKDKQQNAAVGGETIFRDAANNMVRTQSGKRVVIQGLNDFIIVEKEDILLICPKKDEQDIKQITAQVKIDFGEDFV